MSARISYEDALEDVLRREVKAYISSCESLLCSSEAGTHFSETELHRIALYYVEAIDQSLVGRAVLAV